MDSQATNTKSSATTKRYYWTNLAGVSLGILCLNTGYTAFFFLMSSLHSQGGLGSTALAVDYAAQVISCIFLPPFLMRSMGCKWTLVSSGVCIAIFIATNLKSAYETLIPGALIVGAGFSTMFATMNTVVSDLAVGFATLTGSSEEATMKKFFSVVCSCFTMSSILANLISSQILSSKIVSEDNTTLPHRACGVQYCDVEEQILTGLNASFHHSENSSVPQSEVNYLAAACVGFVGMGIIIFLTLLHSYSPKIPESTESSLNRLLASLRLLREPNLLLLILFTFNTGLMASFMAADFTKGFVTCSLGIHMVGLVVMCYGIIMTLGTFLMGFIAPFIPRMVLFLAAVALNITDLLLMLFWTPDPQSPAMFYVMAAIWGLTFTVWLPQLCALYGGIFPSHHQEAYSNHRTWDCVGFVIGFAWSHYVCISTKIYIMIGLLIAGTVGYLLVERRLAKPRCVEPI